MAGEDLGNKADDTEQQGGAEQTGAEQNPASDGSGDEGDGDVKDSHGQPGINKERHDREIAEKDAKIAELEGKLEEAAKTEEGRADLKAEIDKDAWESLHSDTSRPFPRPEGGRIAVKVINHLGDEVMKVFRV